VIDHAADLGADPSKVVLMGHSAGAYNAIMLGLNSHYLRTAGVNPGLVRGVVGLAGPYDFLPLDVPSTQDAFGQTSDLQRTQPTQFARRDGPPLLLLWGEKDSTVHRRSIDAMQHAAQTVGESVEAKIYPGVDHVGIMLALSRLFRGHAPVLDDSAAFIRRVTT
jgi:acetyl esterase/lipase